jgi:hypothetical protein
MRAQICGERADVPACSQVSTEPGAPWAAGWLLRHSLCPAKLDQIKRRRPEAAETELHHSSYSRSLKRLELWAANWVNSTMSQEHSGSI